MPSESLFFQLLFSPLLVSSFFAFILTFAVRKIYLRMRWLDDPKKQQHPKVIHTYPVPRGGGIAIYLAIAISAALLLSFDKHIIGILIGGLILTIVGFFDDRFNLNPYVRLFLGFAAASFVVASGIGIAFITNPFGEGILHLDWPRITFTLLGEARSIWIISDIFALLWIVWSMNMVNWSKGVDGQLPGIVVVAAIVIAFLSFRFTEDVTQWEVSMLAAITAGAYLGFLPWNFYPQKIMPGYGGGSLAGYFLSTLAILSGAKVATMILVLGIPTMDAIYTIVRRIVKRTSPVWGDRGHLHHRLLDLGWSKRKVALFYWSISGLLGLIALQLNAQQKLFTIVTLALAMGGILLWFRFFSLSSRVLDRGNG
jgi:UDP-GlcNAc:undecaprenyl-phosphate GlcNAc-1-phosphate transferase